MLWRTLRDKREVNAGANCPQDFAPEILSAINGTRMDTIKKGSCPDFKYNGPRLLPF